MGEHHHDNGWHHWIAERIQELRDRALHFRAERARIDLQIKGIEGLIRLFEQLLHPHHHPRRLVLLQPTLTTLTGEPLMAAYPLRLNKVAHFVLTLTNSATGALDPVDPADVFSVTSSDPTNLQAVIGTNASGQTEVAVNWLHTTDPMLTGVGISLTDSAGNVADNAEMFDMVAPDHVPDQIGIDTAGVTETDQPVPV